MFVVIAKGKITKCPFSLDIIKSNPELMRFVFIFFLRSKGRRFRLSLVEYTSNLVIL